MKKSSMTAFRLPEITLGATSNVKSEIWLDYNSELGWMVDHVELR